MTELRPACTPKGVVVSAVWRCRVRRKALLLVLLCAAIAAGSVIAVTLGTYELSIADMLRCFAGTAKGRAGIVVFSIRLPRIVAALVCGWGLSLSGLSIQSLLKNPLGSASTLGISQGAAFGACSAVVLLNARTPLVSTLALCGALGTTAVILTLARLRQLTSEAIILAGVALSALFASATVLLQFIATDTQLAEVVFWSFGDTARSGWREIILTAAVTALASLFLFMKRWDLNAVSAGRDEATALGVHVERLRLFGMVAAALMAALITAFHGVIAFVGLIAPHIARRLVGADHRFLIPCSAVIGALLLLTADTAGRLLIGSGVLPVGVITSFMGAPMFLCLLVRGGARR